MRKSKDITVTWSDLKTGEVIKSYTINRAKFNKSLKDNNLTLNDFKKLIGTDDDLKNIIGYES